MQTKEERAAYYQANKEKIKSYSKSYYQVNKEKIAEKSSTQDAKEKISAYAKKWYQANKEKVVSQQKEYRKENKDKIATYCKTEKRLSQYKKYRKNNREIFKRARYKRRALIKQSCGTLSKGITEKLMALQRGKCAVCKTSVKAGHHLDHIMPLALGGTNEDSNIQILCPTCNMSKGAKHPQDFMNSRGFLL